MLLVWVYLTLEISLVLWMRLQTFYLTYTNSQTRRPGTCRPYKYLFHTGIKLATCSAVPKRPTTAHHRLSLGKTVVKIRLEHTYQSSRSE